MRVRVFSSSLRGLKVKGMVLQGRFVGWLVDGIDDEEESCLR